MSSSSPPAEALALRIIGILQSAGHTAYLAGGCVRDFLMKRAPKDFDVATSALPEQVLALFPRSQQVGVAFGVVLVKQRPAPGLPLQQVEVATFRADGDYADGRHPVAVRFTTPEEDARRRDFTCNGLFFDPLADHGAGRLLDFVGGQRDIAAGLLRAIGNPHDRFAEDHLRMLRAVRFAARLGFAIDEATFAAIRQLAPNIRTISKERIHDELGHILLHPTRAHAAELLQSSHLLEKIWPAEVFPDPHLSRPWSGLALLPADTDFVLALIALYVDCAWSPDQNPAVVPASLALTGAQVAALLRRDLLLSNADTADLAWILDHSRRLDLWETLSKASLKRIMADPRWPRLLTLFTAHRLDPEKRDRFLGRTAQLAHEGVAPRPFIDGAALIRLGARPGPAFKQWLDTLYDRQLEGELTTPDDAARAARQFIAQQAR